MMIILSFIFLICHIHFLNCVDIPKLLRCTDNFCNEQISTGRVLKPSNSIHGKLGPLKSSSKIKIIGKNATPENTLWLIEQEGKHGFLDLTFIKENKNNVNDKLIVVKNPHCENTSDETEDDEDSTNEIKLFSTETQMKNKDNLAENDETENFSEEDNDKVSNTLPDNNSTISSPTQVDSDSLKNTNENLHININEGSISSNTQIQNGKNDLEHKNTVENNGKNSITNVKNEELDKDSGQNIDNVKESKENLKSEKQNDSVEKQDLQSYNGKTNELKHDAIKNQNSKEDNNEVLITKEGNVSQNIKNGTHSSSQNTVENNLKLKNNKITDTSEEPIKIVDPISNEKIENINPDTQKNVNSVKSNKSPENIIGKSETKDDKIHYSKENTEENVNSDHKMMPSQQEKENKEKTEENANKDDKMVSLQQEKENKEKTEENAKKDHKMMPLQQEKPNNNNDNTDENVSNTVKTEKSIDIDARKKSKIVKVEENLDKKSTKTLNDEMKSKTIEDEKNSENIPKESNKFFNRDLKTDEKLTNDESNEKINEEIVDRKSENVNIKSIEAKENEENETNTKENEGNESFIGKKDTNTKEVVIKNKDSLFELKNQSETVVGGQSDQSNGGENSPETPEKQAPIKESEGGGGGPAISSDPWLLNNGKSCLDNEKEMTSNHIRSPIIKLILKLDNLSQIIIKSITLRLGFDSSSKLGQFTANWLEMSLENFVSIFLFFSSMFLVVYSPKLLKFNRDWKSEFLKQSQLMKELESKLQSIEEVRHKLTVQNHNFENVIAEYKEKINEIQENAVKNKKQLLLEVEKIKNTNESNVKNLTMDLTNKKHQMEIFETDIVRKEKLIENLEEEKKELEILFDNEKSIFEREMLKNQREINEIASSNEQTKLSLQQSCLENEQLKEKVRELDQNLIDRNEALSQLEKSFEHLKLFEGLNFEEYNEKKSICLDLSNKTRQLELAEENIEQLRKELDEKCDLVNNLEEIKVEINRKMVEFENQKIEAVSQKEAAEMKLNVLSEYFKSKEVEMAKTLGHQVIESTQSMDQVGHLNHRIKLLETENEEMSKTIQRLKVEVKEAQTFAAKCKTDANEEINTLFIKCSNLERSLLAETDENKKLRIKLSRYCGPTPPRNQVPSFNHNTKDRPSSRQSGFSESVGTFAPLPFIPFSRQSPIPNNTSQFSGRNSVNSKKSNNT